MSVIPKADNEPGANVTTAQEIAEISHISDKDTVPERDVGVLEDRSGRITITEGDGFKIDNFVSGTILALKGTVIDGGYFQAEDYCLAGIPLSPIEVPNLKIGAKRELYDPEFMKMPEQRSFIAFASGLNFGEPTAAKDAEFILSFLRGELFGVINTSSGKLD